MNSLNLNLSLRAWSSFLPFEVHGNLEELAEKDEDPDADDAKEARLERVVPLVAVLKKEENVREFRMTLFSISIHAV